MTSFVEANRLYNEGKYQEAYQVYQELGKVFGESMVRYQLQTITKKLENTKQTYILSDEKSYDLDIATKLLLANTAKETMQSEVYHELLEAWKKKTSQKSQNALVSSVNPIPKDWPKDLLLSPLPEGVNDFLWDHARKQSVRNHNKENYKELLGLSIIIPTFNRSHILEITLSCLMNQQTQYPFEVVVADDGSQEDICQVVRKYEKDLDIKYVRQKDYGYQLCAVRNLGLRTAKYPFVSILDCDMAPNPLWVESYMSLLQENDDVALIGPRKYVDTQQLKPIQVRNNPSIMAQLPEVRTNNSVAGKDDGEISVDWRLEHFKKTENLRLCDTPFRFFSGGNVAFAKKWLDKVGYFDEEFTHWGGEDNEFGYRLFKHGCFFRAVEGGLAYHQEPPGKENETDRAEGKKITIEIVKQKVPYFYRKLLPIAESQIHKVPLVTIYIPAYNCADSIQRCVDSALNQTVTDLEVCICNDGSTDNTLQVINYLYGNNPRVQIISQKNGGIAAASNLAVSRARGYYIGQLDSDDYLEPDAVELCLKEFLKDRSLACVYTTNRNVNPDGSLIANGYNWSEFSREKLTTAMIVHHFRMFTARAWHLTTGFDEKIENSVDLDMYLKLSEIGPFKHINKICYNRVLHGNNTSIKKLGIQKKNHFLVVNNALARQGITDYRYEAIDDSDDSRKYTFSKNTDDLSKKQADSSKIRLAFSLIYPDKLDGLLAKLHNILEYNTEVACIVLNINPKFMNDDINDQLEEFATKNDVKIIIKSDVSQDNFKYKLVQYYMQNFKELLLSKIIFDYIIFDNFDSLCVRYGSSGYIKKFDIGMNFGLVNGYWKDKILFHKSLSQWTTQKLGANICDLNCKGAVQGMFMSVDSAKSVFTLLEEFMQLCQKHDDMPNYLAEEVLFQVMALTAEKQQNKTFRKSPTLTYMPWERKLQWTAEQIEEAKQGVGIGKNKFNIVKV